MRVSARRIKARRPLALVNSPIVMAFGRFGAMFLAVVSTPIIARALGPQGRGVTAAALAVFVVMPVLLGMGVPLAIGRRVSVQEGINADLVRTGRAYAALTLVPAALTAIPIEALLLPGLSTAERFAYYLSVALVPLTVSWSIDANVLVVSKEYWRVGILSILQAALSTTIIVVIWLMGHLDVSSVLYAFLAGNITAFVFGQVWVRDRGGRITNLKGIVKEGGALAGGLISDVSSKKLDQIIALSLMGAASAGLYSVAVTIGSLAAPAVQSLGNAAFKDLATGDHRNTVQIVRHAIAVSVMSATGLAVVSWLLIPIVFGEAFSDSRSVALITVAASVFSGVGYVTAIALAAQRHGEKMTVAQVTGLVIGIGLMVPSALAWGPAGAACAMGLGSLISLLISLWSLRISPLTALPRPSDFFTSVHRLFGADR